MGDSMPVALILSFLFPGLGQAYLKNKWLKGIAVFVGLIVVWFVLNLVFLFVMPFLMLLLWPLYLLVWLYLMFDTYKIASDKSYKSPIFG